MRKLLLFLLLVTGSLQAGTVTGTIQTASSGAVANGTLTFSLSQSAIVSGTSTLVASSVNCYTDNAGAVVGLPNPQVLPITSVNYASGTLAAGTYYVEITYYNASGESVASPEIAVILTSQGTLTVNPPVLQPANATGYRVYIGTTSGLEARQATQSSWTAYAQSSILSNGAALPASNTSTCSIRFNDELIPSFTWYVVGLTNKGGNTLAGYPQKWYLYGGSSGTINLSLGTPLYSGVTVYPQAIVTTPLNGATQSIGATLNVRNLEGWRFHDQFIGGDFGARVNAAVADIGGIGGQVIMPSAPGSYIDSTTITTPNSNINFSGHGPGTSILYGGSGNAFNITNGNTTLRDFSLTCNTGAGNCIQLANGSGNPSIANNTFWNLSLTIGGNAAGKALFDINGSSPGNVYGTDLFAPHFVTSASHGLQIRSNSGIAGAAAQPPITNIFGGNIGGMGGYGINVDATGSSGVPGNGLTVIGTNLQGNTSGAVNCNTCASATFIDLYTENSATQPPMTIGPAAGNRNIGMLGNSWNGGTTPNTYCVNISQNSGSKQQGIFGAYNNHLNCTYGYNINNVTDSWLGMADTVNVTSPGAGKVTNWSTNTGWKNMVVWDGTIDYTVGQTLEPYFYIGSDHTFFDDPLFLYGVNPGTQTAKFQIGEMQPASVSGNGTTPTDILKVVGASGGATTGTTGQTAGAGSNITLTAGNGGTAPGGSTNGAGGNITLTPGAAGAGAGNAGAAGKVVVAGPLGTSGSGYVSLLNQQPAASAIVGTNADATVYTYTLPANTLGAGKCLDIVAWYLHSTGTASVSYKLKFGAMLIDTNAYANNNTTNPDRHHWEVCNNAGVQNAQVFVRDSLQNLMGLANTTPAIATGTAAVDFTQAQALSFTFNVANTDQVTPKFWKVTLIQ